MYHDSVYSHSRASLIAQVVIVLPRAFSFALSPQGDDFWQDTLRRLDYYSQMHMPMEGVEYLNHKPPQASPDNPPDHWDFTTKPFMDSVNNAELARVLENMNNGMTWDNTVEGQWKRGRSFWRYRHNCLNRFYQDKAYGITWRGITRPSGPGFALQ